MCCYSELNKARAAVHKVSELFSRRDPMRKYMDQIIAMAAEYGEGLDLCLRSKHPNTYPKGLYMVSRHDAPGGPGLEQCMCRGSLATLEGCSRAWMLLLTQ